MSTTMITKKELHVPVGAILEVADVLIEHDITSDIVGTDADEDTLILELQYDKEQRDAIHEIEDIIADFEEDEEQLDEDNEEKRK